MENMHYAEELVKEFLVFRGFTSTLQSFEAELSTDIGKGYQVDKILDLIFLVYVPKFQAEKLVDLLGFFKQYFSTSSDTVFLSTLSKLEVSILRYYIVHALQSGRKDKVIEFFGTNGNNLLLRSRIGFHAIPYLKNPSLDPQFRIYFSKERFDAAQLSVRNLLSEMFNGTHILQTVLPLGEDPPAITSLCFNHNGKILAASATDGMIHMFDMAAGLQITGWPGHDSAISSVLFGPDETSIFSLGCDGKIFEWSLHNQGQVLWSRDSSRFCKRESAKFCKNEMALDANGRRLLVTSDSVRSPIYQVQGHARGLRTLPHNAAITTVDWHPTLPIYLTGSADHSVRVTSIS